MSDHDKTQTAACPRQKEPVDDDLVLDPKPVIILYVSITKTYYTHEQVDLQYQIRKFE